mmetsp:Transcript_3575/g.5410  ORF Transcript_3575/g.5410 Transcript_3575/m.5410 type:complete len:280 (-) Transcript_3575:171-1010(-)
MTLSSVATTIPSRALLFAILLCTLPFCFFAESTPTKVDVKFSNALSDNVDFAVFWRSHEGELLPATKWIPQGQSEIVETYSGHHFFAYDKSMSYFKEFMIPEPESNGGTVIEFPVHELRKAQPVARFINSLDSGTIEIFWKNIKTNEEVKVSPEIKQGEWFDVETHQGHKFVAKTPDGEILKVFDVQAASGDRQEFTVGERTKATFFNKMGQNIRLFWINSVTGRGIAVSDLIGGGASHTVYTSPGHKFAAYDENENQILEFTVTAHFGDHEEFYIQEL